MVKIVVTQKEERRLTMKLLFRAAPVVLEINEESSALRRSWASLVGVTRGQRLNKLMKFRFEALFFWFFTHLWPFWTQMKFLVWLKTSRVLIFGRQVVVRYLLSWADLSFCVANFAIIVLSYSYSGTPRLLNLYGCRVYLYHGRASGGYLLKALLFIVQSFFSINFL